MNSWRRLAFPLMPLALGACTLVPPTGGSRTGLDADAAQAVASLKAAFPQLQTMLVEAPGYAVFPHVSKGGLGLGGAHGVGELFEGGKLTGFCDVAQGTFGAQIGGQVYRELVVLKTPKALARFKVAPIVLAMRVSGVGGDAGVALAHPYENEVEIFVQPIVGLMGEAAVGAQQFSFVPDAAGPAE